MNNTPEPRCYWCPFAACDQCDSPGGHDPAEHALFPPPAGQKPAATSTSAGRGRPG